MVHVEITQDGKSIFSENYDENDIRIERRRAISALFKTGEMKASEIAPSRYCQDIIVGESVADGVIGTRTNVKDDAIMISHIPTWAHHCTVK
jgi:hypothetical protein